MADKITIWDIAAMAKVSAKSVSRVVNGQPGVGIEKRAEIERIISETGFRPNASARALRTTSSSLIALFTFRRAISSYYADLLMGAMAGCMQTGYHLVVEPLEEQLSMGKSALELHLSQLRIDGAILVPPICDDRRLMNALDALDIPYVRMSPAIDRARAPLVEIDDERAGHELVTHLIELGHRDIAMIELYPGMASSDERKAGYLRALSDADIPFRPELVSGRQLTTHERFAEAEAFIVSNKPPTAIVCGNDEIAFSTIGAAYKHGLKVPDDLSVVGFDDSPAAAGFWPPLTTVHQPVNKMAETATLVLSDLIKGAHVSAPATSRLDYHLVLRASTGPARRSPGSQT